MKKVLLLIGLITLFSCTNGGGDSDIYKTDGYDRIALLNSIVENNILPAFEDLDSKLTTLNTDILAFVSSPETNTLASVKTSYLEAYKVWQHVQMFNVLLASGTGYKGDMNTFPTDYNEINEIIDGGFGQAISEINFSKTSKNDTQGFPAIDYLINGAKDVDILNHFTTDTFANQYKELLTFYIDRMVTLTNAIIADWNINKTTFISDNTNTLTSSFNLLVNDYIFYIEKEFREAKIAFPAGVRDNVTANATRVESYYSAENSKILFGEAFTAVQNIFTGTPYQTEKTSPIGLVNYLDFLNAEVFINDENIKLSYYIENTLFENINTTVANLDSNFATQIETDNTKMENAFTVIQNMVVALKVDTLESFNVGVDYVDNDGD